MRFLVVTDDLGFNRLPRSIETARGRQANREDGGQYRLNLFERTNEDELNGLENKVATCLDRQERLFFWYRNRARKDYYVQGWKRGRIYADFIFTLKPDEPDERDESNGGDEGNEYHQVFMVETKGPPPRAVRGHRLQAFGVRPPLPAREEDGLDGIRPGHARQDRALRDRRHVLAPGGSITDAGSWEAKLVTPDCEREGRTDADPARPAHP